MQTFLGRVVPLLALAGMAMSVSAADGLERRTYNYSKHPPKVFSEAVTLSGLEHGKLVFLAGVGSEDEEGPRGRIRHPDDFAAQCRYAYDKIKRALAANGATLGDAGKIVVYLTDIKYRDAWAECHLQSFAGATVPANTLLVVNQLSWPEMKVEVDVTAAVRR